ncbi:MAG TPA: hypothetical protein VF294_14410, partial [Polyangiaceae bacterium]
MFRRSFSYVAPFALVLSSSVAFGQTAPAAPAPAARPVPTNLAPPPAPAGAVGPDAPVSKVT